MNRFIALPLACCLAASTMLGCTEHKVAKEEVKITTPGGTTTETVTKDVKKTGDHKDDKPVTPTP